jgi:hypothetical protein
MHLQGQRYLFLDQPQPGGIRLGQHGQQPQLRCLTRPPSLFQPKQQIDAFLGRQRTQLHVGQLADAIVHVWHSSGFRGCLLWFQSVFVVAGWVV